MLKFLEFRRFVDFKVAFRVSPHPSPDFARHRLDFHGAIFAFSGRQAAQRFNRLAVQRGVIAG